MAGRVSRPHGIHGTVVCGTTWLWVVATFMLSPLGSQLLKVSFASAKETRTVATWNTPPCPTAPTPALSPRWQGCSHGYRTFPLPGVLLLHLEW